MEQVKTMLRMKANKKLLQQHIRKETGRCSFEVVEKEGVLQALFYQRTEWQHIYKKYPEVILIDATYKLNDLRMPLYLILCVDGNGESEVVAMWLVSSEDKVTMKAMIGFFIKHNGGEKTTCVMANKDWVERDVIKEELPHASLLICLFHMLRSFCREVSEKSMCFTQDQRQQALEFLERLAYSANEQQYFKHRDALLALGLHNVIDYFLKQWDNIRHEWVEGLKKQCQPFVEQYQ
ncbi:hypothetical protein EGW08_012807 [Elysia chlorotica]|uniref:ZSWIM1/3 RNaseH-like domain-containing protein n=1 Tax=Elysia chlorotica TaxID=188477 RepID=A0A433TD55_ELYCH|nr:hypothetical protein EGW08_012807 [Elysia chlorotica]